MTPMHPTPESIAEEIVRKYDKVIWDVGVCKMGGEVKLAKVNIQV